MDMCIYCHWEQIKIDPSKSEESDDGMEHEFEISEEMSHELWEGKYPASIRVNWKWVEKITLIITNPEDEKDNED